MKTMHTLTLLFLIRITAFSAAFQNLDFESALLPTTEPGQYGTYEPISEALPGWRAYLGDQEITSVLHNNYTLGQATVNIYGPDLYGEIYEGDYTVQLYPGASPFNGQTVGASISQEGLIPNDCQYLLFKTLLSPWPSPDPNLHLGVFVNSEQLDISKVFDDVRYSVYMADVSMYRGQDVDLRFTAFYTGYANSMHLDSVEFIVPEPGSVLFWTFGAILAGCACLFRRRWRFSAGDCKAARQSDEGTHKARS